MSLNCELLLTAMRNKDGDDSKKDPVEITAKTALGRRASGVPTKSLKPGESVWNTSLI